MNDLATESSAALSISAVERETGLSKDVLRVWERRYGFPVPMRDAHGERLYPLEQVERLRTIKRLMDAGNRPGKLLALTDADLERILRRVEAQQGHDEVGVLQTRILELLRQHDVAAIRHALAQLLMKQGLQIFVTEFIAPLNRTVTEASLRGHLQLFEEHLYREQVQTLLRHALVALGASRQPPKILLASPPNESHGLGLLLIECLLRLEGAECVNLGSQTPIPDVAAAAAALEVDIVTVSLSSSYGIKPGCNGLESLRALLPQQTALWVAGELTRRIRRDLDGVSLATALPDLLFMLREWRAEHQR